VIEEVQISLKLWIEGKHQKENNIPVSVSVIQDQAMGLYDYWKKDLGEMLLMHQNFMQTKAGSTGSRIGLGCVVLDQLEELLLPKNKLH
jgi:hypothetical protein